MFAIQPWNLLVLVLLVGLITGIVVVVVNRAKKK
ncbi:F0F1-type ATP synthase assembly protein I [Amycolatopsis magusensis]|uniref:F0F1-type ATP synthase assembly protein I n=1 Tax=Amycolatopsis magusensis TaxID=882444 RepID=A0ABS4PRY0_9PSEU|nr:F0F1-type ATP synthase assembly protein I [Amycolatopsis magusensis]